ncbi:MAG: TolC family protein [Myxococcaceae bacterium]|nr:TolC family protein [Myxococcaceae bacterium]
MSSVLIAVAALSLTQAPVALAPGEPAIRKMTMDDCVREALGASGQMMEQRGKIREWEGRLKEVESTFWPKLQGLTYLAPIYGVKAVNAPSLYHVPTSYVRDFSSWGPYFKFQGILAQPLGTFGRYDSGKEAATERIEVQKAMYESARNALALEVRKYYLLHLYAKSFLPSLDLANRLLKEAQTKAEEEFKTGSGSVTQVDLNKLKYGGGELAKAQIQADIGAKLALAALKHTMGMPQNAPIDVVDTVLPPIPNDALKPLATYIDRAAERRPEVAQLFHGEKAARAFKRAEMFSSNPTAFVAAQLDLNWTPMWPVQDNPWAFERFNLISPGVAAGLQFDIDIAKSLAREYGAQGLVEQIEGLKKFAATGIPMEVRKAYDDTVQAELMARIADEQSSAGKKWLVFAGAGYAAGTGEAKDVLEGLVAYMGAKRGLYDALQAVHLARATLHYATGSTGLEDPPQNHQPKVEAKSDVKSEASP